MQSKLVFRQKNFESLRPNQNLTLITFLALSYPSNLI